MILLRLSDFFKTFYQRNIFERLIIYSFLSALIVKIVFELILGQWSFLQSQNTQWVFFAFLGLDYLLSVKKVINIRVTVNPLSIFAFFLLVLVVQGIFVGVILRNNSFVILNDTIPLLIMALNILRMQSAAENSRPIDFKALFYLCTFLVAATCFVGFFAQMIGQPTQPDLGNSRIYIPLFFTGIFLMKPFPKWVFLLGLLMIAMTLDDLNRTTMAFIAIATSFYLFIKTLQDPVRGLLFAIAFLVCIAMAGMMINEDSKTYRRIEGLSEIDLTERTGSIGERQAEQKAIQKKIESKGKTIEWLGLGFGGLYEVQFTYSLIKNYGHAHYAWAWFNLRFGKLGYIYMFILLMALFYNGLANLKYGNEVGVFVSFMCLLGILYCATHVNSVFLLSGLHFFHRPKRSEQIKILRDVKTKKLPSSA